MNGVEAGLQVGQVVVLVGRGLSTDELTQRCVNRLFYASDRTPPAIRAQAEAFRLAITAAVRRTVEEARRAERTDLIAELVTAGQHDAAMFLRGN